jgi:hypothetical protein
MERTSRGSVSSKENSLPFLNLRCQTELLEGMRSIRRIELRYWDH